MKLLKETIQEAMARLDQIQDKEDQELFEREIWLHVISILSYQHGLGQRGVKGETQNLVANHLLPLLNPALPFYSKCKQVYMSIYSPQEVEEEKVELYATEEQSF